MAKQFDAATDLGLRAAAAFKKGKVPVRGLLSVLDSIKDAQGVERGGLFPVPKETQVLIVGSTAQSIKASAGRVYGVRAVSGTLKDVPTTSTLDVVVTVLDDTVQVGKFKLTSNEAGEAYFFGKEGIGFLCTTSINVKAFAIADGTSDPATADKPTVTVLFG